MPLPRQFPLSEPNGGMNKNTAESQFSLPPIDEGQHNQKAKIDFGLPPDEMTPTDEDFSVYPKAEDSAPDGFLPMPVEPPKPKPVAVKPTPEVELTPKEFAQRLDKTVKDSFYSVDEGVLHPYDSTDGGKKINVNVGTFDKRKNIRTRYKVATYAVILCTLSLIGFGVKQTFFPSDTYSDKKVMDIVSTVTGSQGFPVNSGRGFVHDFMKAYLNLSNDERAYQAALGYFYNGTVGPTDSLSGVAFSSGYSQKVLIGPTVYSVNENSAQSATYTVGAFVEGSVKGTEAPKDGSSAHWVFFSVSVYFDPKTASFAVAPNSPSLTSPPNVEAEVPQAEASRPNVQPDKDLSDKIKPNITGFLNAYSKASRGSTSEIEPFTVSGSKMLDSISGLGGKFTLDDTQLEVSAWPPADEKSHDITADVKVSWKSVDAKQADSANSSRASVTYTSYYTFTLTKQSDGSYKISDFNPSPYTPKATDSK